MKAKIISMGHAARIRKLQASLGSRDSFLLSSSEDIFYYTGYRVPTSENGLACVSRGKPLILVSPLSGRLDAYGKAESDVKQFLKSLGNVSGIDQSSLPVQVLKMLMTARVKAVDSTKEIKKPREVKDSLELGLMNNAIRLDRKVLAGVQLHGKSELQVAAEVEKAFFASGAGKAFDTIVASGSNAGNYIHHFPTSRKIRREDMVILDFGSSVGGYCSDVTRTSFSRSSRRQKSIFEDVLEIQQSCIDMVSPGARMKGINDFHKKALRKKGYRAMHGVGHGIGLEVHEPAALLKPGMVVTIEPGAYARNFGGCRIEDMVLVTKNGRKVLSGIIPFL